MKPDNILKEEFCDILCGANPKLIQKWTKFANKVSEQENLGIEFDNEFGRVIDIMLSPYNNDDLESDNLNINSDHQTLPVRIWAAQIKCEKFQPAKANCPYHRDNESDISRWQEIFKLSEDSSNFSYKEKVQIMSPEVNISTSQQSSPNNPSKPISLAKYKKYLKREEKREARMCQCKTN